jgi:hypothetical protein
VWAGSLLLEAVELLQGCHSEHGSVRFRLRECLPEQRKHLVCGPAVYFVLTRGDLQRREWTLCCSVVKRVEKYSLGGSIGEEIHG